MNCEHEEFDAHVEVNRLEDIGAFAADVTIRCRQCQTPFQFLGLPQGIGFTVATCSADSLEARLPIAPRSEGEREIKQAIAEDQVHILRYELTPEVRRDIAREVVKDIARSTRRFGIGRG